MELDAREYREELDAWKERVCEALDKDAAHDAALEEKTRGEKHCSARDNRSE